MRHQVTISHNDYPGFVFLGSIEGNRILSITRIMTDSNIRRLVSFGDLPAKIQAAFQEHINAEELSPSYDL